jgi:hypothetical protein
MRATAGAAELSSEAWTLIAVLGGVLALATLVGAVILAVKVVRTRKLLGDLGAGGKVAFYGALIYTIFPVDLLPDPVYLDDMGVLTAALIYLTRLAAKRRAAGRLTRAEPAVPASTPPGRRPPATR